MGVKKEKKHSSDQELTSEENKLKNNFKVKSRSSASGTLNFKTQNKEQAIEYVEVDEETGETTKVYHLQAGDEVSTQGDKSLLNIVVEEEDRSYKIKASNLEEILTKNKKVKRIVIEDINVDKAQRMEIHVDNRKRSVNNHQQVINDVSEIESSSENVKEIASPTAEQKRLPAKTNPNRVSNNEDILPSGNENVLIDKVELVRTKSRPKNISSYYYRAKEHLDLYQVGMSFLRDIREKKKCFSFEHLHNRDGQQNTILGVSLFLMFHVNRKSLVITHDFDNSVYSKIMGNKVTKKILYPAENMGYPVVECDGIRFIEYIDLFKMMNALQKTSYEDFIDHLIDTNDTVLIDFPELEKLDQKKEIFFPLINCVDNISFVIDLNNCTNKDLKILQEYFGRYNVPIKGVTVSQKN